MITLKKINYETQFQINMILKLRLKKKSIKKKKNKTYDLMLKEIGINLLEAKQKKSRVLILNQFNVE
jgi:ATP adenylyltransferase/5',5'''-P-1,P-4-tetraphosphate phosphorylase II